MMATEQAPLWFQNYVKQYEADTKRNFKEHAALEEKIEGARADLEGVRAELDALATKADLEGVRVELKSLIEGSPTPGF